MQRRAVSAYPWGALELIERGSWERGRRAARAVSRRLELTRVAAALGELLHSEVSIAVRGITTQPPSSALPVPLRFALGSVRGQLYLEPEFAAALLSRVLGRPVGLDRGSAIEPALAGAISALAVEVTRRAGAREALRLSSPAPQPTPDDHPGALVYVESSVLVAGAAYRVIAAVEVADELAASEPPLLAELGALPIAVPLVVAQSRAERAALGEFQPGNAWFPGDGWWIDRTLAGRAALAAGAADRGCLATLSADGKIVLRGETVVLDPDLGESMSDQKQSDDASLTDAVLDSPVVVRVELGAVSMSAREWAELRPGDVIETGKRIAEPVVLRVAGREVAQGELVSLEGELGVRIRQLVRT